MYQGDRPDLTDKMNLVAQRQRRSQGQLATDVVARSSYAAKGDVVTGHGNNDPQAVPLGDEGTVLTSSPHEPGGVRWVDVPGLKSIRVGDGLTLDDTDPLNPILYDFDYPRYLPQYGSVYNEWKIIADGDGSAGFGLSSTSAVQVSDFDDSSTNLWEGDTCVVRCSHLGLNVFGRWGFFYCPSAGIWIGHAGAYLVAVAGELNGYPIIGGGGDKLWVDSSLTYPGFAPHHVQPLFHFPWELGSALTPGDPSSYYQYTLAGNMAIAVWSSDSIPVQVLFQNLPVLAHNPSPPGGNPAVVPPGTEVGRLRFYVQCIRDGSTMP